MYTAVPASPALQGPLHCILAVLPDRRRRASSRVLWASPCMRQALKAFTGGNEDMALQSRNQTVASASSAAFGGDNNAPLDGTTRTGAAATTVGHLAGCNHTENGAHEWWEVDLVTEQELQRIEVWNRPEYRERLAGARLVVLNFRREELASWTLTGLFGACDKVDLCVSSVTPSCTRVL